MQPDIAHPGRDQLTAVKTVYFKDNSGNIKNSWKRINSILGNKSKTRAMNEIEFNSRTY